MLKNLFISEVRVKILSALLLDKNVNYHVRGLVRKVDAEINAVRRELENLESIGLVTKRQSSNRLYYTVNVDHLLYPDLLSIISKESGLGYDIIKNVKSLGHVDYAMIARPFLAGRVTSPLEVDVFFVGDLNMDALEKIIKSYEHHNQQEINYSVMTYEEFVHRKRSTDPFVTKILSQPRSMLVGNENKFCSLV